MSEKAAPPQVFPSRVPGGPFVGRATELAELRDAFGAEPQSLGMRVFGALAGRCYLRTWLERSLDSLKEAAEDGLTAAEDAKRASAPRAGGGSS
jgi:hypothetical protein